MPFAGTNAIAELWNRVKCICPTIETNETGTTGTWTGTAPFKELKAGQRILLRLMCTPSGNATLNLTLADGSTTGAVNCWYNSSGSRLTTNYPKGSFIYLVYQPSNPYNANYGGWVRVADYDANTAHTTDAYDRRETGGVGLVQNSIYGLTPAGKANSLVTTSTTANTKARCTEGFRIGTDFWYYTSGTVAANTTLTQAWRGQYSNFNSTLDFRYSSNCAQTLTAGKPVYLVGTVSNGAWYLDSTWWTQTLPTAADGKVYVAVGCAYSNYQISFNQKKEWLAFDASAGGMVPYAPVAERAKAADSIATADGVNASINKLGTGAATPTDGDYYISQYVGGGTSITTYHRRPHSALWEYIKGKISSVLGLTAANYGGNAATASSVAWTNVSGRPSSLPASNTTDSYSSTGTAPVSGKAVASAIGGLAPKASPAFTGTPTAPTAAAGTNTTQVATTAFVKAAVDALDGNLNSTAPSASKTLTAFSQTDGKVSATFGNISIAKSQVTDFPTQLSQFTDNLGSSPTHTHSQYLTSQTAANTYQPKGDYALQSALTSAVNHIVTFDTTYTYSSGTYTFTPHVYVNGEEITSTLAASKFSWTVNDASGRAVKSLSGSKTFTVTKDEISYVGNVVAAYEE